MKFNRCDTALAVFLFSSLSSLSAAALAAPSISSVTAAHTSVHTGQPVKITVNADNAAGGICGLVVHYGDGKSEEPQKVGGSWPEFPRAFEHTYARPGTYTIKAEGQRAGSYLSCSGEATLQLTVEAPPPPPVAAPAKPQCPEGWAMKGKVAKNGAFTCTPKKKGAKKPETPLPCPEGTNYFASGNRLGCGK